MFVYCDSVHVPITVSAELPLFEVMLRIGCGGSVWPKTGTTPDTSARVRLSRKQLIRYSVFKKSIISEVRCKKSGISAEVSVSPGTKPAAATTRA